MPFAATWMELEIIILSEVIQKESANTIWNHLYVEPKIWHKWTYQQNRNRLIRHREQTSGCQQEKGRGMYWEFGVGRCKVLHLEWISNKLLVYRRGNYIQYPVVDHNGKEHFKSIYICVCVCVYLYNWITLLYTTGKTL